MQSITKKQKEVFDYIKEFSEKNSFAPSLEEIRKRFRLASVSTSHHYVNKLQRAGYLEKGSNQPRSISLSTKDFIESPFASMVGYDSISLPIVGSANCGPADVIAEENIEGYLKVSRKTLSRRTGVFVLRASGDSMNRADVKGNTIENGDFVIIDSTDRTARDGDYVLSIIDGAANLKRCKIGKDNQIMLVSESSKTFKPILIHAGDDFAINGKIMCVMKKPKMRYAS